MQIISLYAYKEGFKMKKSLIAAFLAIIMIVSLPAASAQEEEAGVTPDSFLWGVDRALEQIELAFTFGPDDKAKKGLEIAQERLLEVQAMAEEGKVEEVQRAEESHSKTIIKVKERIAQIEEDDSELELERELEIESELLEHENEIRRVKSEIDVKIKIEGDLTEEQKELLDSFLTSMENSTGEVRVEIETKKEKTKIRIREQTGKSESEIEDEIEEKEKEKGIFRAEYEVESKVFDGESFVKLELKYVSNMQGEALVDEILDRFSLSAQEVDTLLEVKREAFSEDEKFEIEVDFDDGQAEVEVEIRFALDTDNLTQIKEEIVQRTLLERDRVEAAVNSTRFIVADDDLDDDKDEREDELEIEVEIEDGKAFIEIQIGNDEIEFVIETVDREEIIQDIVSRTNFTLNQVSEVIEFKEGSDMEEDSSDDVEEEEEKADDDNDEDKTEEEEKEVDEEEDLDDLDDSEDDEET
ncbi:hypothetical protein BVX95_02310 [archaeon D22]|nr:hypothetical protein BVX95_02310 [archaeon D22]